MKKLFLLIVLFTINYSLFADLQGQAKIDSLLKELLKAKNDTNEVNLLHQLSYDYHLINPDKGIDYGNMGLGLAKELKWKQGIANNYNSLAVNYSVKGKLDKSLKYYQKSLKINEELGNKGSISTNLNNIGNVYTRLSDYDKSLKYYQKSLKINEELGNKNGIASNLGNIGRLYFKLTQDTVISKIEGKSHELNLNKAYNLERALKFLHKAAEIAEEIGAKSYLIEIYNYLQSSHKEKGDYKKAYEYLEKWSSVKDSVFSQGKAKEIAGLETKRENEIKDKQIKIQKLELENARNQRWGLVAGIALLLLFSFVVIKQRANSEKLLLNILPKKIAKRLKKKEYPIADHINEASVLFADIVNFTELSEELGAEKTVKVLNNIYTQIDEIVERIGLEKIKTIGDCYMAVAGVPLPTKDHCERVAQLALEIQRVFKDYKFENGRELKFRIGIDCGEVTAGVIGRKKFIYDLWGDTVNTASRMEEFSEIGKIQCTSRFRDKLVDSRQSTVVSEFKFEERAEIEIKGKGLMKTYFLISGK